jgi:hypothetical protein
MGKALAYLPRYRDGRRSRRLMPGLHLAAFLLLTAPATAQPRGPIPPQDIVVAALVSGELGQAGGRPDLLLGALAALAVRPAAGAVAPPPLADDEADSGMQRRDLAADLRDAARLLARGDPALLKRIADLERAAISVPAIAVTVPAGTARSFRAAAGASPVAGVLAYGLGRGRLELVIADAIGRPICPWSAPRDQAFCAFSASTPSFDIELGNPGTEDHEIVLVFF